MKRVCLLLSQLLWNYPDHLNTTAQKFEDPLINLYIKERQIGDVTVLDLKGRLRVGGATVALHRSFRSLVQEEKIMILLNLTGVTHIDSSGLGELISSHVTVFNKGGEIKLVQLTETLRELMSVTKLLTVFDVYETEADALLSFQNHPLRVKESKPSLSRVG